MFTQIAMLVLAGAMLGVVLVSFGIGPLLVYTGTPTDVQAQCMCADLIRSTTKNVLQLQAVGGGMGGTLALVAGVMVSRREARKKRDAEALNRARPG